jgi:hypothetical protein
MARIRSSFAGRLFAAVLLLVLLPTAVLGLIVYSQARSTAMASELSRIESASRDLATRIDAFILSQSDLAPGSTSAEAKDFVTRPRDAPATARSSGSATALQSDSSRRVHPRLTGHVHRLDNPLMGESYGIRPYFGRQ